MTWQLGPFTRAGRVISDRPDLTFTCPVLDRPVAWAAKDVFNAGAVVRDGKVCLLVRGEDAIGRYRGTSRLGIATSDDGLEFTVEDEPVLFPADDRWQAWEWPGGCEDPRVVEAPGSGYVCTYTAFDGKAACLFVATSDDLHTWTKHGPAFAATPYAKTWSKSGSILTEVVDGRLVAATHAGKYWMFWGEGTAFAATSDDLTRWTPLASDARRDRYLTYDGQWDLHRVQSDVSLRPILAPRRGRFDSLLVEPGPPAVRTGDGIVLIYHGANHWQDGDPTSPARAYQPGQVLLDPLDPTAIIARVTEPFLRIEGDETNGQVDNVCFAQGLVLHRDRWMLYCGMADSTIGCATAPVS
jgi:predicted GH43/DUF377 family glycosyl hydrolase